MQIQVGAVSVMDGFLFLVWEKGGKHLHKGKCMLCLREDRGRVEFFLGLLFFNCLQVKIILMPKGYILGAAHSDPPLPSFCGCESIHPPCCPSFQGRMHNGLWSQMTGKIPGSDPNQRFNLRHHQPAS